MIRERQPSVVSPVIEMVNILLKQYSVVTGAVTRR